MAVLEAQDVTKSFRRGEGDCPRPERGLAGVERGEVVGLEGPSGSGKTTLLVHSWLFVDPNLGTGHHRGRGGRSEPAGSTAGITQAVDRFRVPAVQSVPGTDRAGERGIRTEHQGSSRSRRAA